MYAIERIESQNQNISAFDINAHIRRLQDTITEAKTRLKDTTTIKEAQSIKTTIQQGEQAIIAWQNFQILQIGTPVCKAGKVELGEVVNKELHGSVQNPLPQVSVSWNGNKLPMPEQPNLLEIDTHALAERVKVADAVRITGNRDVESKNNNSFEVAVVEGVLARGMIVASVEVEGEMYEPGEYEVLAPDFDYEDFQVIIHNDGIDEQAFARASTTTLKIAKEYARQISLHPVRIARIDSEIKKSKYSKAEERRKKSQCVAGVSPVEATGVAEVYNQENFPALPPVVEEAPLASPILEFVENEVGVGIENTVGDVQDAISVSVEQVPPNNVGSNVAKIEILKDDKDELSVEALASTIDVEVDSETQVFPEENTQSSEVQENSDSVPSAFPVGIYEIPVENLKPYPRNTSIYGIEEDDSRLESTIRATGWVKPLLANTKGEVLGGNRRLRLCKKMGKEKVLVEVREFGGELAEMAVLLADNEVRDKSREQRVREGLEWKALISKLKDEGKSLQDVFSSAFGNQENFPGKKLDSNSESQSRDASTLR